jgi:dTDP-4-dehydrorhamnose reductase
MKIAIFGVAGQLGRDVASALSAHSVVAVDHARADIRNARVVAAALHDTRVAWVVNCAAMTHVDGCETDPLGAFDANALGARNVSRAATVNGARLVHISTDYVFDGEKTEPYTEDDLPYPVNIYGFSKLAGESAIGADCARHLIVRTSGLYGAHPCRGKGTNFVETMLARARAGGPLRVVSDEVLTPTFTADLAAQIRVLIGRDAPGGVYHATNAGACSWFDFTREILRLVRLDTPVEPIRAADWKSPARRPRYSVLENRALASLGIDVMPDWKDALGRYLSRRKDGAG